MLILGLAMAGIAWDWGRSSMPPKALAKARFVGRQTCSQCHQPQLDQWLGSHHERAMDLATDESVLADFNNTTFIRLGVSTRFFRREGLFFVHTEGPDGQHRDYRVKYTFGVDPLQQYMVEFPDGRVQVLRISWDTQQKKWFYVAPPDVPDERILPDDPLHWTGIGQNWNTTCAECHSTNLEKNYDLATDTYHTTFSEINVSCEECHGPGSLHVELAQRRSLFWDRNLGYGLADLKSKDPTTELETCAKCHSRRNPVHDRFRPGQPLLDHYEPALLMAGLYQDDGQILDEVYVYGSFLQSRMHAEGVRCTDCHQAHSLQLKFKGNRLCAQCHSPGKYDTPAHHHHPPESTGAQCIACHMPSRLYMVNDLRHDHSFRIPRPDLSVSLGTSNACNDCHCKPNETYAWASEAVERWFGKRGPSQPPVFTHWAPALAAGNRGLPEGEALLLKVLKKKRTPAIVKATAANLLGQYPGEPVAMALQKAMRDSSPLVRTAATQALTGNSYPELISSLMPRLRDPVRSVRIAAVRRLIVLPLPRLGQTNNTALKNAIAEFRENQHLLLDRAAAHINLSQLDQMQGDLLQATRRLQTAIRLEPYLAGPRSELASILEQSGLEQSGNQDQKIRQLREQEAELLERDVKLLPDHGDLFYRLGLLRYLLGQLDHAETALTEACRLAPQAYPYHMALALLQEHRYETEGNEAYFDATVEVLKKMEKLRPSDPSAKQILLRILKSRQ